MPSGYRPVSPFFPFLPPASSPHGFRLAGGQPRQFGNLVRPVALATPDVLRHKLRHPEEHTLEVGVLVVVLDFYEHQAAPRGLREHIHAVVLVVLLLPVALALQQVADGYLLTEQRGGQTLDTP